MIAPYRLRYIPPSYFTAGHFSSDFYIQHPKIMCTSLNYGTDMETMIRETPVGSALAYP